MGRRQGVVHLGQRVVAFLAVVVMTWAMLGCAKPTQPTVLLSEPTVEPNRLIGQIAEVSPPETLEVLKQIIDAYTPQVRILSPRPGEILDRTTVSVRVQVRGLPLFKDETWQLGPHLHIFLDGEPYRAVYDLSEPLVFENLAPGTHTLRVFASRPWHESFKNQGAFDQRTFHVLAQTPQNEVNSSAPLLTYSRPQGSYGAEPIMLDFYLTNAPLHLSAQEDDKDDLHDWRIRCTVNGQSFVFDQWQPIYLKGFQPGQNWVQLELIDETGRAIDNRFNNTVRIIDYQPGGTDTLSRLVRGELDLREVAGIIDPTYLPPRPEPFTEPVAQPTPEQPSPPENQPALEPEPNQPLELLPIAPAKPRGDIPIAPQPSSLPEESSSQAQDLPPEPLSPLEAEPKVLPSQAAEKSRDLLAPSSASPRPSPEAELGSEATKSPVSVPSLKPEMTPLPTAEPLVLEPPTVASPQVNAPIGEEPELPAGDTAPTLPAQPEKATGAKGLMNRFRDWQEKQRSPTRSTPIPRDGLPMDSEPIYQAPNGNAPVLENPNSDATPAESPVTPAPQADTALPRVMPELIEPDLTQPDSAEPRTQAVPILPEEEERSSDGSNATDPAQEQPSASAPAPPSHGQQNPLGNPMNRPYI